MNGAGCLTARNAGRHEGEVAGSEEQEVGISAHTDFEAFTLMRVRGLPHIRPPFHSFEHGWGHATLPAKQKGTRYGIR